MKDGRYNLKQEWNLRAYNNRIIGKTNIVGKYYEVLKYINQAFKIGKMN